MLPSRCISALPAAVAWSSAEFWLPSFWLLMLVFHIPYSCSLVNKPYPILQPFEDVTRLGFCHEEGTNDHMLLYFMQFYYRKE